MAKDGRNNVYGENQLWKLRQSINTCIDSLFFFPGYSEIHWFDKWSQSSPVFQKLITQSKVLHKCVLGSMVCVLFFFFKCDDSPYKVWLARYGSLCRVSHFVFGEPVLSAKSFTGEQRKRMEQILPLREKTRDVL